MSCFLDSLPATLTLDVKLVERHATRAFAYLFRAEKTNVGTQTFKYVDIIARPSRDDSTEFSLLPGEQKVGQACMTATLLRADVMDLENRQPSRGDSYRITITVTQEDTEAAILEGSNVRLTSVLTC